MINNKNNISFVIIGITLIISIFFYHYKRNTHQKIITHPEIQSSYIINISTLSNKDNIVPFLVLGSGPASLSAALYGARMKVKTVVLKGNQPGGQLTGTSFIENWPAIKKIRGVDVMTDLEEQAAHFGAIMINDSATKVDLTQWPYYIETEDGLKLYALSVMIGTGATPRKLNIPGEQEYWGKGVTTCAICDAPYHKGDNVIVIGGGDSAIEETLELSSYAKKITMLVRSDNLRASPIMIEKLKECSNFEIIYSTSLTNIVGNGQHVTHVTITNNTSNEVKILEAKGVFLAIGHIPNSHLFKESIHTDHLGYITLQNNTQSTNKPGVFAAGDVSDYKYRQAGVAAGDGIKAGLDAIRWLSDQGYNSKTEETLEPFLFNKNITKDISIQQITNNQELNQFFKKHKNKLIVLDFYTHHCPSCMHMFPVVESISQKLSDKIIFCKIDAATAFDIVKKYKIKSVPHLIAFKKNKQVGECTEALDRTQMFNFIKKCMAQ